MTISKVEFTTNATPEEIAMFTDIIQMGQSIFIENLYIKKVGSDDNDT
jgi:hypothetical protein